MSEIIIILIIVDFGVSADYKVKINESEKTNK